MNATEGAAVPLSARNSARMRGTALLCVMLPLCGFLLAGCQSSASAVPAPSMTAPMGRTTACAGDAGLQLPEGFCASVFADGIGHARHIAVSPSGVVYVNTWSGRYYRNSPPPAGGFLVALQDTQGSGKADVIQRFGETLQSGGAGGTGIAIFGGWLFAEINDKIVRYTLPAGAVVPNEPPTTIVSGLPLTGDHPMHPFSIDADGSLYVDVASASNSCQVKNRMLRSPGIDPCMELETRAGIWRFDASAPNQVFSAAQRYATGLRNAEGIAIDEAGHRIFVTQHGRDQLRANWPELYQPEEEATLPAEEVLLLTRGSDYGWPECYYDPGRRTLVLAPEYGGDGGKTVGRCAAKSGPVAAFPAHWAPNDMLYYDRREFPAHYRRGLFIAFHGSWDRAPYGQQGYNIVYRSLASDGDSGSCEIFADGFSGAVKSPGGAEHRPSGLGLGPDGALYVSDDVRGRIYRIVYMGGSARGEGRGMPCPDPAAGPGPLVDGGPGVGGAALPVPEGGTPAMVALGNRIFHGEVAHASCTGCHGADGSGTAVGPDLTRNHWIWSDGSLRGIATTIQGGVPQPSQYRAPMPAMGGAQLTADQVTAVAAYVWALSHGGLAPAKSQ